METLKSSETLIEGLVASEQDGIVNLVGRTFPEASNLGKGKCIESALAPLAESSSIDLCKVKGFDRVDSSSHGYDPINGISLFVDLTGGVTDINKPDVETIHDPLHVNQVKIDAGQQEFTVNVGDLVWAVIEKQKKASWWPGIVCDSSTAPKEATNGPIGPTQEDGILVKCFGNGKFIWFLPYQVKPFFGYFEQLPTQSKAIKFIDAFEKALVELGNRVKTEFTCSCFSERKMEKTGKIGELSVARFEPAGFLDYIKDLARNIYIPNKIDYVVKQNCLSAFYKSLGHLQIPLHELKPENDNEKSENQFETRERRKSRFLLYPGEDGVEESKLDDNGVDLSQSQTNDQPVKKPLKKRGRKKKVVQLNVCSLDVISQLRFAGQDCLFPYESKNFDSVERFISGFRKRVFKDDSTETLIEMQNQPTLQETLPKKVRKMKEKPTLNNSNLGSVFINFEAQSMENKKTETVTGQNAFFNFGDVPLTSGQPTPCKLKPKKRKKNVENNTFMPVWNGTISPVTNVGGPTDPFLNRPTDPLVNGPTDPFLNRPADPFVNGPTNPYSVNKPSDPYSVNGLTDPYSVHVARFNQTKAFRVPYPNEIGQAPLFLTESQSQAQMAIIPTGLTHQPNKRGRKRKHPDLQANPGQPVIPNLNQNEPEKKNQKRIRKSKEIGVPCIDLSYSKVQQDNQEIKGTAFLLKFSTDHPLPCHQDLNSVFSKYGQLIESETQILTENASGQVVFLESSSAGEAFWGLQNNQPFGPALVNYRIQHLAGPESVINFKTPIKSPVFKPIDSTEIELVKRSNTIEEIRLPSMNNSEVTGTALLLKFSPDYPLPTFQGLNSVFGKYGELNEPETWVSGQELTGQVVFVNPCVAGEAVQKLEKDRPFGPALISYRVHHLYNVQSAIRVNKPISVVKPPQIGEARDLAGLKKNLEMMNSMLEKAGDSLSLEMRVKLENEIKGLMNKVSSMDGSSSC